MGAVLALHIASIFPINSLVLIAPVLKFKSEFKTRILVPLFNKMIPITDKASQYKDGKNMTFYGYSSYPNKALNEMRKLTNLVKKKLIKIKSPTLLIHSESDLTCIIDNYHIVNNNIKSDIKEKLIVKKSSHNMISEKKYSDEYDLIYQTINQFINKF